MGIVTRTYPVYWNTRQHLKYQNVKCLDHKKLPTPLFRRWFLGEHTEQH